MEDQVQSGTETAAQPETQTPEPARTDTVPVEAAVPASHETVNEWFKNHVEGRFVMSIETEFRNAVETLKTLL